MEEKQRGMFADYSATIAIGGALETIGLGVSANRSGRP